MTNNSALERSAKQRTVLLTSYRRDGTPVGTPVNIAVESGRAYVRTFDRAWKLKRIRNNPIVDIAPSTMGGRPTGPAVRMRARILSGDDAERARRAINRKHPLLHGVFVPLTHRLRGYKTVYIELTPGVTNAS